MKKLFILPLIFLAASCFRDSPNNNERQRADSTAWVDSMKTANGGKDSLKKDARKMGGEKAKDQILIEQAMETMKNTSDSTVGFWVGTFGHNKINIAITEVKDGKVSGYSVCAGNFRALTGTEKTLGKGKFSFVLDEPGTDKYDGHFDFTINTITSKCNGKWAPFQKDATEAKVFELNKEIFAYSSSEGDYPEGSQRLLTKDDVDNKMKDDLTLMRQEIYARHGYSFKNPQARAHFDALDWYIPMGVDIRESLSENEVKNIDLIYTYETYMAENYDDYGR